MRCDVELTTLWEPRRRTINLLETSVQSHSKLPESKRNLTKSQQSHSCVLRHFLNFYIMLSRSVVFDSLWPHGLLLCSWNFAGKNTGAGCHFLLQGIFPTQGSFILAIIKWRKDPLEQRKCFCLYLYTGGILPCELMGFHIWCEPLNTHILRTFSFFLSYNSHLC